MASEQPRGRVTVAVHAPDRAFAPGVQTALVRLGYNLISSRTASRQRTRGVLRPELRIVDDRQVERLGANEDELPTILLVGARAEAELTAQVLGAVKRRARLSDLYRLLQEHLEEQPRTVPRVGDTLPARATRGVEAWTGAIRSISEKGCFLQSSAPLRSGSRVELCFPLAREGLVQLPAQPSYQNAEGTGLVFDGLPDATREALADYVTARLGT